MDTDTPGGIRMMSLIVKWKTCFFHEGDSDQYLNTFQK